MITYAEALVLLQQHAKQRPIGSELIPIEQCAGRVLHQDIRNAEPWPHFTASNMDGFAVRAEDAGQTLRIAGQASTGDTARLALQRGQAIRVNTGAVVPQGADAVVPIEQCEVSDHTVQVPAGVLHGQHVRATGSDREANTLVLSRGRLLDHEDVLLLAAAGLPSVLVARQPRLALISTGNELVPHHHPLSEGKVRNTTTPFLCSILGPLSQVMHCDDSSVAFAECLRSVFSGGAESHPDVVITTGAVSMGGKQDFLAEHYESLGAGRLFHKVAIRPGKPILAAALSAQSLWLGLPGNPLSSIVGVEFFLRPYLRTLLRQESPIDESSTAILLNPLSKPAGLRCFFAGTIHHTREGTTALVSKAQASYRLDALRESNAWLVLPETAESFAAGDLVEWRPR